MLSSIYESGFNSALEKVGVSVGWIKARTVYGKAIRKAGVKTIDGPEAFNKFNNNYSKKIRSMDTKPKESYHPLTEDSFIRDATTQLKDISQEERNYLKNRARIAHESFPKRVPPRKNTDVGGNQQTKSQSSKFKIPLIAGGVGAAGLGAYALNKKDNSYEKRGSLEKVGVSVGWIEKMKYRGIKSRLDNLRDYGIKPGGLEFNDLLGLHHAADMELRESHKPFLSRREGYPRVDESFERFMDLPPRDREYLKLHIKNYSQIPKFEFPAIGSPTKKNKLLLPALSMGLGVGLTGYGLHSLKKEYDKTASFPDFLDVPFSFNHPHGEDTEGNPRDVEMRGSYNLLGPILGAALGGGAGLLASKHKLNLPERFHDTSRLALLLGGGYLGSKAGGKLESLRTLANSKAVVHPDNREVVNT
jgi:hypothetical protein